MGNGGIQGLGTGLWGLTLKVGGALEPISKEWWFWLGLSFMVGVWDQVSPGSGNSSGGLRYSSSEVMGLLKGDVDPPGGKTEKRQWHREKGAERRRDGSISPSQGPDQVWNVTELRSPGSSRRPALP